MTCYALRTGHPIRTAICRNDRSAFNNRVAAVSRMSESVFSRLSVQGEIFDSRRHFVIWLYAQRAESGFPS